MKFQHRKIVSTIVTEGHPLINKLEALGKEFVRNENFMANICIGEDGDVFHERKKKPQGN